MALLLDGKTFADDAMVVAVGVLATGEKRILGMVQTATENRPVCAAFLRSLLDRGLRIEEGCWSSSMAVRGWRRRFTRCWAGAAWCSGANGTNAKMSCAIRPGAAAGYAGEAAARLRAADLRPRQEALAQVRRELTVLNTSAAASLDEGLEDTLTLHRLGCFRALGLSLKTTNVLESIHARIASRTDKVDYWKNSDQKHRWLATALLDLEPRLHRIKGFAALPQLQQALLRAVRRGTERTAA